MIATRNEIFNKIQPVVSEAIFKMLQKMYPVYVKNNSDDVRGDINIELLKTIDVTCKIFANKEISKDKILQQVMRNNSIDVFIISSTLTAVERKIEDRINEDSINFSLQVIQDAFGSNLEAENEKSISDLPIIHLHTLVSHEYGEIDDLNDSKTLQNFFDKKIKRISNETEKDNFEEILKMILKNVI